MLRFVFAADGSAVAVVKPEPGYALPTAAGPNEVDVTSETNPTLVTAADTDLKSFRLVGGVLTRNGAAVTINPPTPVFQAATPIDVAVRTTTATPSEILRRTLAPTTAYRAHLTLVGIDAGNGNLRCIEAAIVAKRLGAGALLVGTPVVIANHQDTGASTWAIAASVSGNDFVVTATGAAGRTIDWRVTGDVWRVSPGGLSD